VARTVKILVQTTTPRQADDWSIESFTLLRKELASIEEAGLRFEVDARDRDPDASVPDLVLSTLDESDYDELWLFALDEGNGLTEVDCAGIARFRRRGGGLLSTRDHQDVGASLCGLAGGTAHHFQTRNPEPECERQAADDIETPSISWPNYHSGRNGDFQTITVVEPAHDLVRRPGSPCARIEFLPAHPHEGAVSAPSGDTSARVIARGRSRTTGREFNLAVAFERSVAEDGSLLGRAVADSSFHHFADYNWDPALGCPSFVTEPVGDSMKKNPCAAADARRYVRNLALWLAPEPFPSTIGGPR
jgi:hypothetical protein